MPCRSFCTTIADQNFLPFSTKQNNIQFQYSAQTGLSLLKPALSNILYYSTLSVLTYTTDTCGDAVVLQNNDLIILIWRHIT